MISREVLRVNYDQAVLDFLLLPENLKDAFEIARRVDQVKSYLRARFWQVCGDDVQNRLAASGWDTHWQVLLPSQRKAGGDSGLCRIAYRGPGNQTLHLDVALAAELWAAKGAIYYGLIWSQDTRDPQAAAVLAEFMPVINAMNLGGSSVMRWPFFKYTDYRLSDDDLLLRFATDPPPVVSPIIDVVWEFFAGIRQPLEAANEKLDSNTAG